MGRRKVYRPRTRPARCPRCRGTDLVLCEVWGRATITFDMRDGMIETEGILNQPFSPESVEATCTACEHVWTLQGVMCVGDLPNYLRGDEAAQGDE